MDYFSVDISDYCELTLKIHRFYLAMQYAKEAISADPLKRLCEDPEFRDLAVERLGEEAVIDLEAIRGPNDLRHWSNSVNSTIRHGMSLDTCMGPPRVVPGIHFVYAFSGNLLIDLSDETFLLQEGQTAIFDLDMCHGVLSVSDNSIAIGLLLFKPYLTDMLGTKNHAHPLFNEFYSKAFYPNNQHRSYLVFDTSQDKSFRFFFSKALFEFTYDRPFSADAVDVCVSNILIALMRAYSLSFEENSSHEAITDQIRDILDYIDRNLQTVTLVSAAHAFHFSTNHLSRVVKQNTGSTFLDLVHRARLREATYLLRTPEYTVSEVARMVGYNNVSYFYKLFDRQYHKTPNEYREEFGSFSEKFRTKVQQLEDHPFQASRSKDEF